MNFGMPSCEQFASILSGAVPHDIIAAFLASDYTKYQRDPVGFGQDILGETYTDDVKNMMESVRDNVVTVAKSANATGKSHGAARVAVWWYKCFPDSQVYTAAAPPEDNLKRVLWGEIGNVVSKNNKLFDKTDSITNLEIKRAPLEFIAGVAIPSSGTAAQRQAKFSGKHAPHLLFIIDEGDAVPDEVYAGIESCMSGGKIVRLLIMFNPRAAMGAPYRMERDGLANVVHLNAFNHPNVVTGENRIPGAVDRETTVRRINQWCRPLQPGEKPSPDSVFVLPAFLEGAVARSQSGDEYPPLVDGKYVITNPAFAHMVLGRYPAQGDSQLISREWIAMARDRWNEHVQKFGEKPPDVQPIMGVDVADKGMDNNVVAFRFGGFLSKMETWPGIDIIDTGDKCAALYHGRKAKKCYVDATGVGAGVAPYMRRLKCLEAYAVMVASRPTIKSEMGEFTQMRDQLWWSCREWLRTDPYAALPPDERLIEELSVPTYEVVNGKIKIMPKDEMKEAIQRSPDRADALCMTFATGLVDVPARAAGLHAAVERKNYYYG